MTDPIHMTDKEEIAMAEALRKSVMDHGEIVADPYEKAVDVAIDTFRLHVEVNITDDGYEGYVANTEEVIREVLADYEAEKAKQDNNGWLPISEMPEEWKEDLKKIEVCDKDDPFWSVAALYYDEAQVCWMERDTRCSVDIEEFTHIRLFQGPGEG